MRLSLESQPVKHEVYGQGLITDVSDSVVTVLFLKGQKKFLYPDAFCNYLTLKDSEMQQFIEDRYQEQMVEQAEALREENRKLAKRSRLLAKKSHPCAQICFHVDPAQTDPLMEKGILSVGCILSGINKGEPRVPGRVMPNSACLLTGRPKNKTEKDRRIYGVMMTAPTFCGGCCKDGCVICHESCKIRIPDSIALPYWKYFKHGTTYPSWGRVPFKYFENAIMPEILKDIFEVSTNQEFQKSVDNFAEYFCHVNRFPPMMLLPEKDSRN